MIAVGNQSTSLKRAFALNNTIDFLCNKVYYWVVVKDTEIKKRAFDYRKMKKFAVVAFCISLLCTIIFGTLYADKNSSWKFCENVDNQRGYDLCIAQKNKQVAPLKISYEISLVIMIIPAILLGSIFLYEYTFPLKKHA